MNEIGQVGILYRQHCQGNSAQAKEMMSKDRTKHNILPLSKFGLMQITRQRVRSEMNVAVQEKCPTCQGTGEISPAVLLTDQIEDQLASLIEKTKETF